MATRSKYNVRTDKLGKLARTCDGIVFDSVAEMRHYAELCLMKKAGNVIKFRRQERIHLFVNGSHVCDIVPDFTVRYADERGWVFEEVKGAETAIWKLKLKLFKAVYPNSKYVVIKAK